MENFTVPDFISTNTLKDLSSKIRANKRERISEYLEEKKLLPNFKNIKKAKRALEVRISNEVLNPDYSNISAEITSLADIDKLNAYYAKEAELEASTSQVRSDFNTEIENINDDITAVNNAVKAETNRAIAEENAIKTQADTKAPIDSPTFTGIPQIAQSPDEADSSQRIPSTNWVNARIAAEVAKVSTDMYYTKAQIQLMMVGKADLVDGKVPESQLPKLYIVEVE